MHDCYSFYMTGSSQCELLDSPYILSAPPYGDLLLTGELLLPVVIPDRSGRLDTTPEQVLVHLTPLTS